VIWFAWKAMSRSPVAALDGLVIRALVVTLLVLAIAGLQWLRPREGMNVFFVLDRSDSIPSPQQEAAEGLLYKLAADKNPSTKRAP